MTAAPARVLMALAAAGSLSACATDGTFPANPEPKGVLDTRAATYFGPKSEDDYYCVATPPANPCPDRKAARDDLILNRIRIYGDELAAFQVALKNSATGIGLGTNLMALILNGFGATTGTAETKAALSAAAGGFTAANGVISTQVFQDKTVDAIIAQMNADFDRARLDLYTNLRQSDAEYPLARAETDLTSRIRTIGVSSALTEIAQKASAEQKTAQANVLNLQWTRSPDTDRLDAWLFAGPDKGLDLVHAKALQDWLNAQPEPKLKGQNYALERFVHDPDPDINLAPIRSRALTELNIP